MSNLLKFPRQPRSPFVALLLAASASAWAQTPAPSDVFKALSQAGIAPSSVALVAQPVSDGVPSLFEHNANQPLTLASTTKIVTSLAALDMLGGKFRWRTRAYLTSPIQNGVLEGDMLLVGGGNASLGAKDLVTWFKKIQARGLRAIKGHIVVNHGAFQFKEGDQAGTPVPSPENPHHVWPDAFVLDEGVITVELATKGAVPELRYSPRMEGVEISNELVVSKRKCSALREAVKAVFDETAVVPTVRVTGEWAPGCGPNRMQIGTAPGSRFTELAVAAAWRDAGGTLEGGVIPPDSDYVMPPLPKKAKPFAVQDSPELADVLVDMNKWSNNLIARHVMLSLSKGFPAKPATMTGARSSMAQWLSKQGIAKGDLVVANGSGLAHEERGRASAMVMLLRKAWTSPYASTFLETLPVAGEDGTMSTRLKGADTKGKAYLKTGTLKDTRSLAGYVQGKSGRMYAVVAIINDPKAAKGRNALDQFIEWVMENG